MISLTDRSARRGVTLALGALLLAGGGVGAQAPEESAARKTLETGRQFLRSKNYTEAVRDFQAVLEQFPNTSVADDSLLELALYQLDIVRNPAAADTHARDLIKRYPTSDSVPMALIIQGRVLLMTDRSPDRISAAQADFDRVALRHQGTDAVPIAMYYGGEAARLGGNREEAVRRFTELATAFPNSSWTAGALLGSAASLTRGGQAARAMEQLQRIRQRFPGSREAAVALDWNTTLYRLYLRAPAHPAFVFSGRTVPAAPGRLRDVVDIALRGDDTLLVAARNGVLAYDAKGTAIPPPPSSREPRGLTVDPAGEVLTVHELDVRRGATPVTLVPPMVNARPAEVKPAAVAVMATGEYLVADREAKRIMKFDGGGRYVGDFASTIEVRRLAISELDEVAVLHSNTKLVTVYNRQGTALTRIAEKGEGYQLRNPVDVAFDQFGHLFVMDRSAVLVFAPESGRLLTTFSVPERAAGSIGEASALALDAAGRLYVFDQRTDSVKVFR